MLLVKTTLACSPIHGIGLFADQCILQGTRIWEFTPGFNLKLSGAFLAQAAEPLRSWLYTHTYLGRSEVFTRLSDPLWFQALGAVMGMDGHSCGMTTAVMGALERGLHPRAHARGMDICGGRGK
jgi:hypothetical protein